METANKMEKKDRMASLFGFSFNDFRSIGSLIRLLRRPCDPASLGVTRILFGVLMMLDVVVERGMHEIDIRYAIPNQCAFPLFNLLKPMSADWMAILYFAMFLGAVGIMLGFMYRLSCSVYCLCYWYLFLLDKTTWNNHSYLYGLLALQFLFSDAHFYRSLDGLLNGKICNTHVPLWNYFLIRFQIFTVYFIAGLKKLDPDWISGYSMENLSSNWVFEPFRYVSLPNWFIDLFIVHIGGFTLDLTLGFVLFFDKSRPFGLFFGGMFHLMNSTMFTIGMFPYAMLATLPIFCYPDWPRRFISRLRKLTRKTEDKPAPVQRSMTCIYESETKKSPAGAVSVQDITVGHPSRMNCRNLMLLTLLGFYVGMQCFLPYSHSVTKGYNTWTNGLYGYSWDMMVHSWKTQRIAVSYMEKETGRTGFLNPEAWSVTDRWSNHGDMLKQYATCVAGHLQNDLGFHDIELYFDVWKAMNKRFLQRMFDPRVDMVTSDWRPFSSPHWVLPVLYDLSSWRNKIDIIQKTAPENYDIIFVADLPGLALENYVETTSVNVTLEVLDGIVLIEFDDESYDDVTLNTGEKIELPSGQFHNIYTISDTPACYFFLFYSTLPDMYDVFKEMRNNNTLTTIDEGGEEVLNNLPDMFRDLTSTQLSNFERTYEIDTYKDHLVYTTLVETMRTSVMVRFKKFYNSFARVHQAAYNIWYGPETTSDGDDELSVDEMSFEQDDIHGEL